MHPCKQWLKRHWNELNKVGKWSEQHVGSVWKAFLFWNLRWWSISDLSVVCVREKWIRKRIIVQDIFQSMPIIQNAQTVHGIISWFWYKVDFTMFVQVRSWFSCISGFLFTCQILNASYTDPRPKSEPTLVPHLIVEPFRFYDEDRVECCFLW